MLRFILKRILMMIPVLVGVSLIIFTMMYFTPDDAADMLLGDSATIEQKEQLRKELKLDQPYLVRYVDYMKGVLHGDLGTSYSTKRPVMDELLDRFPTTLKLAAAGVLLSVIIGVTMGIISATRQYSIFDNLATAFSLLGVSIPNFWLALMLIIIFAVNLKILPPSGFSTPAHWILPVISLGLNSTATIMRMTRSSMLEVVRQDYIRTARAKGQKEILVILRHALPNALIPIITVAGLQFGRLMGGAVMAETVFSIAGIGKLMVDAIKLRNSPVVQGGVLFIAFATSIVNLIIDILYAFVDPRIRSQYMKPKSKQAKPAGKEAVANADATRKVQQQQGSHEEHVVIKKQSQTKEIVGRFMKNKMAVVSLVIIILLILMAVFADQIAPFGPDDQLLSRRFTYPCAEYPMGTDDYGRDILSRVIYGARTSLTVGLVSVTFSCAVGIILGSIAGFYGQVADNIIMRLIDILLAIPNILLALSIASTLGPGLGNLIIAVGIGAIPGYARIVRASILSVKQMEYIEAARSIGASDFRLIMHHILPNCLAPIIVQATMSIAVAILSAASLSFLGLGITPPTPEWGSMLSAGRAYIRDFWPIVTFPGLMIMITVFAFNIFGDGLRDALDPKLKV